jgi:hypothetical protein
MDKLKEKFLTLKEKEKLVQEVFKEEEKVKKEIKKALDSKYLKLMHVKSKHVCFKANKKLREYIDSKDEEAISEYVEKFMSKVMRNLHIDLSAKDFSVLTNTVIAYKEYKIYVRI